MKNDLQTFNDNGKYLDGVIKIDNNKYYVVNISGERINLLNLLNRLGFNDVEIQFLLSIISEDILFIDWLNRCYSDILKSNMQNDLKMEMSAKIMEILKYFLINSTKYQESLFVKQVNDAIIGVNDWLASSYAEKNSNKSKR